MVGTPLSGDPVLASDIKIPRYVPKTVSQNVTSSTVLVNDNSLFAALPVGVWRVELFMHYNGDTTGDIQVGWTTTGTITSLGRSVLAPGRTFTTITDAAVCIQGLALATVGIYGASAATAHLKEDLLLDVSVTGTLQLQWAQNTSSATALTVSTASRMIITEVEAF